MLCGRASGCNIIDSLNHFCNVRLGLSDLIRDGVAEANGCLIAEIIVRQQENGGICFNWGNNRTDPHVLWNIGRENTYELIMICIAIHYSVVLFQEVQNV